MHKKFDATGYDTDKSESYLANYEHFFAPYVDKDIKLLELGINKGGSILLWRDYFTKGTIVGLDYNKVRVDDPTERVHLYQGKQQDLILLDKISGTHAPDGFDIIIDDCSHIGELTRITFWHLFDKHLKPGGLYIIEDWGTGYWNSWIDGKKYNPDKKYFSSFFRSLLSKVIVRFFADGTPFLGITPSKIPYFRQKFRNHSFGMVGFIKQLTDECAMADITHKERGIRPNRRSKIKNMQISNGQVILVKSTSPQ